MFLHPAVDATTLPPVVASLATLLDRAGASFHPEAGAAPPGVPGGAAPVTAEWLAALAAAVAEAARLWRLPEPPGGAPAPTPGLANPAADHADAATDGWADGVGACLLGTPSVEVRVVRWAAGQGTPAHDHGGALSALAVVAGELVEDRFEPPLWRAAARRRRLAAGTVVTLPADHAHVVANPGPEGATSIHVVSPPALRARHRSVGAASFLAELSPLR